MKMKYKAVEQELRTAEETVRDVTSIEFDLRQLLRSKEEEIELLKEKLGKFKRSYEEKEKWRSSSPKNKIVKLEELLFGLRNGSL